MIFVTHDQSEALAVSDRVVLLAGGRLEQHGTPEELYQAPRTRFAADFIGAANLLPALVGDAGSVTVLGRVTALATTRIPGEALTVALRPEAVAVLDPQAEPGLAQAQVVSVGFGGDRYDYRLRTDDGTVVLASPVGTGHPYGPGDRVGLRWSDEAPILLGDG